MESVSLTVLAADPISGAGAAALLRPYPTVSLLAAERRAEADVLLVLAGEVTTETLDAIEQAVRDAANPRMRVVLVGDMVRKQHLLRAVNCGLISLIPRREASTERLLRAVIGARDGRAELPTQGAAWLLDWARTVQSDVLTPIGLTTTGLVTREVEVIKLLADGLETAAIAQRLNYSERTIKNIIHGAMSRLQLRNRAHAVAYAFRTGVI
ncbi:response regulator transcription factor [Streptomyces sp. NPDC001739]